MTKNNVWWRAALQAMGGLGIWLACATTAHAECASDTQTQRNRDGSQLVLQLMHCSDAEGADEAGTSNALTLTLQPRGAKTARTLLVQADVGMAWRAARLHDVEGDGTWELELTGECGAGPNCEAQVYKLSADRQRAYLFFDDGYASFEKIPGYYVAGGRASCCSWEFHLYRLATPGKPITQRDFVYRLSVNGITQDPARACLLTDQRRERPVAIRDPHIRKLCKVYD